MKSSMALTSDQHIVGTIHDVEFIDDRWRDGLPNRVITLLTHLHRRINLILKRSGPLWWMYSMARQHFRRGGLHSEIATSLP